MAPMLQIIIAAVLVALCACLVPLLLQLRRTARAVEKFADSARQDLSGMAGDVHQVRQRVDQVADLAAAGLALPGSLGEWLARAVFKLPDLMERKSSGWLSLLMTGLQVALQVFLRSKAAPPAPAEPAPAPEACHE